MTFAEFIKGKRVVFVGPAPILIGRGLGEEIESFDVVVKTGPACLINNEDYFRDYGRRIDVLYMNAAFCRYLTAPPILDIKAKGLKYIRTRIDNENQLIELGKHFDVGLIPFEFVNKIFPDSLALMGTIALLEMLQFEPAELWLTGVDFNTSRGDMEKINRPTAGDFKEYIPGYIAGEMEKTMNMVRMHGIKDAHNHMNDARLTKELIDSGKVKVPGFVLEKLCLLLSYAQ